jgi:hypothetical protein
MGQLGFFDLSRRYEGLDVEDDPLVAIAAMIPWESLRPKLKASLITGGLRARDVARKDPAGRKPWDEVVTFKALVEHVDVGHCLEWLAVDMLRAAIAGRRKVDGRADHQCRCNSGDCNEIGS